MPKAEKTYNRYDQHWAVYFPKRLVELRYKLFYDLQDIDMTLSVFVRLILKSLIILVNLIRITTDNWRHYEWGIWIRQKKTQTMYFVDNSVKTKKKIVTLTEKEQTWRKK